MTIKKKILHVLWSGKSGGAERFVRDITFYLEKERFENIVIFLSEGGWLADTISQKGTKVFCLDMRNGWSFLSAFNILRILKAERINIVHIHCRNYLIILMLILFRRAPLIYFEHGGNLIGTHPEKERIFYKLFGPFFKTILANSEHVKNQVIKASCLPETKVKIFYIGIDLIPYNLAIDKENKKNSFGIPPSNKVVGIVGRLMPAKGMDDFIKICAIIDKLKGHKRYSYVIIGDGALRKYLDGLATKLHVDIKFLGDRQDVPETLKIFDLFLFTSRWESFGIALLEAMASKIPVVGFNIPGANEIMDKNNSVMIEERDHQRAAECVIDMLEDPRKCQKLTFNGHENIRKNFNIQNTIRELDLLYESLSQI